MEGKRFLGSIRQSYRTYENTVLIGGHSKKLLTALCVQTYIVLYILHYPLTMMVACSFKILVCVALFTLHTHTVSVSAEAEAEAEADQVGIHTDAEADVIPASFFSKVQNFWWASGNGRGF